MEYEFHIPVPPVRERHYLGLTKALREMDIGASVFIPANGNNHTPHCLVSRLGRKLNRRYVVRRDGGGFRIWRAS